MKRWWLSFADPQLPRGEQFLGLAIESAHNELEAIRLAHMQGAPVGVEVAIEEFDETMVTRLSFPLAPFFNRFVPRAEAQHLADRIGSELLS